MELLEYLIMLALPMCGGGDLLDFVPGEVFWKSKGVQPTSAAMMTELRERKETADASAQIEQLGDADFRVREKATAELRRMGPSVIPQLKEAAKSSHAERSARARRILKFLDTSRRDVHLRRLMAIRSLREMKHRPALPVLKKLAASEEHFVAEYARRAAAAIEGRPFGRSAPTREQLDADVAVLPARCGAVVQIALGERLRPAVVEALRRIAKPRGPPQPGLPLLYAKLLEAAGEIGNARLEAITIGVSEQIEESGFAVIVGRGLYDRRAVRDALTNHGLKVETQRGIDVVEVETEVKLLLASDERLVLISGDNAKSLPIDETLAALATGRGRIGENEHMAALIRSAKRDAPLWGVLSVSRDYRAEPVFAPLESIALFGRWKDSSLKLTAVATARDAGKLPPAVKRFEKGLKEALQHLDQDGPAEAAFLEPLVAFLKSVRHSTDGRTVTVTAAVADPAAFLVAPLQMMLMFGGF